MTLTSVPTPSAAAPRGARAWAAVLLWAGVPVCVFGTVFYGLWQSWRAKRVTELVVIAVFALFAAWGVRRLSRWTLPTGLVLVWFAALIVFAGALPTLATVLFAFACIAVGDALSGRGPAAFACVVGLSLAACTLGWLLPLPVHGRWAYLACCALAIALRWRSVSAIVGTGAARWRDAVRAAPVAATAATLALGLAATSCWLPTLQFDDVGYHLRLPWTLQSFGRYPLDAATHVWALAPWASDVLQAVPQLISGAEARGPVNALWIAISAAGVWTLCTKLGATARAAWSAIALYASLPLTAVLGGSMQTETMTAALAVWLVAAGLGGGDRRMLWGAAAIAGALIGTKLSALALVVAIACWAIVRARSAAFSARTWMAACVALGLGGSSYLYAEIAAGNPFLPLFNAWFQSPEMPPVDIGDARWHAGYDALLPWHMTFQTTRYLETYPGGIGFVFVALAGAWLLALGDRAARSTAWLATWSMALILLPMQYARYAFPTMVLLIPALSVAAWRAHPKSAPWLFACVCALNFAFQANGHWMLREGVVRQTVKAIGRDTPLFASRVPERQLMADLRERDPRFGNVLALDSDAPTMAEAGTRARTISGYDPSLQARALAADRDAGGGAWVALLEENAISDVIVRSADLLPARAAALNRMRACVRGRVGDVAWWSLRCGDGAR